MFLCCSLFSIKIIFHLLRCIPIFRHKTDNAIPWLRQVFPIANVDTENPNDEDDSVDLTHVCSEQTSNPTSSASCIKQASAPPPITIYPRLPPEYSSEVTPIPNNDLCDTPKFPTIVSAATQSDSYISVTIEGKKIASLLDSGAGISLLSYDFFKSLKVPLENTDVTASSISGNLLK